MEPENGSKHQSGPVMATSNFMILEVGAPGQQHLKISVESPDSH